MASAEISTSPCSSWSDLLPDLLGLVIAGLPFPADRARFRAVCRAWHSVARHHMRQLPWIVLPDGSFCTVGDDGAALFSRIAGLPENVTCLGSAADGWLALDSTDDVFRRTNIAERFCVDRSLRQPRCDVKHAHAYLLHDPFSGETVPLPELDSIAGDVAETFEIRKVLMRSTTDDVIAVTTSNWNCNIILCRPGKGSCVLDYLRVIDVAFHGDQRLYGITPEEELVAIDLAEDDRGKPIVTKLRRVIKQPLADGEEDPWLWMYRDDYSDDDDDGNVSNESSSDQEDEAGNSDYDNDDIGSSNEEAEQESHSFNGDGQVPDGVVIVEDKETPYQPKAYIVTTRRLVRSSSGELLMVRHHQQAPRFSRACTRGVEIFRADIKAGKWVPVNALAQGEALFLSRSFCKSTGAYGGIEEGCIYFADMDDVFDTKCWAPRLLGRPEQWSRAAQPLLTWLFPPQLLV
ncbi:unnamed protein product [Urochloa decumbens]|uniref:KIB1-4 beta-propeller domain-containing protein n=1 Tax=Urochloa decumbens TaxID=240449 RepID=A0ABC9BFP9_9POAL